MSPQRLVAEAAGLGLAFVILTAVSAWLGCAAVLGVVRKACRRWGRS